MSFKSEFAALASLMIAAMCISISNCQPMPPPPASEALVLADAFLPQLAPFLNSLSGLSFEERMRLIGDVVQSAQRQEYGDSDSDSDCYRDSDYDYDYDKKGGGHHGHGNNGHGHGNNGHGDGKDSDGKNNDHGHGNYGHGDGKDSDGKDNYHGDAKDSDGKDNYHGDAKDSDGKNTYHGDGEDGDGKKDSDSGQYYGSYGRNATRKLSESVKRDDYSYDYYGSRGPGGRPRCRDSDYSEEEGPNLVPYYLTWIAFGIEIGAVAADVLSILVDFFTDFFLNGAIAIDKLSVGSQSMTHLLDMGSILIAAHSVKDSAIPGPLSIIKAAVPGI
ncbi:hypothetical protein CYMTET_48727 [Cymbomonas tetramitiformis]|uniref:Uncharacterized protein n=1 Tax=Cymbomonas tetramitiformis TaxID=36881 RepID=A0AAE0BSY3_9CHLO|nr:hypothetical protein CYMTET_48727 [Cymbomonas tetramitiformis]